MPNSEYLRLKGLLESNPQYKIMLDTISKAEGTWGPDAYSTAYGGKKIDWRKGKDKTVRDNSSAHGKYQFMNKTWFGREENGKHIPGLQEELELSGFSPEEQDVAALKLLENTGALKHIDDGELDKAIYAAAPVWAALPKDASGQSAMPGQKAKPLTTVLRYAKSNEAARAAVNDDLKKLNETYTSKDIQKEKADYLKEIRTVNAKKISDEAKNLEKHNIKQKYYREGKLMAINKSIVEDNKTAETRRGKINKLQQMADDYNSLNAEVKKSNYSNQAQLGSFLADNAAKLTDNPMLKHFAKTGGAAIVNLASNFLDKTDPRNKKIKNKADDELVSLAKELGIKLKYKTPIVGYNTKDKSIANIDIDALKTDIKKHKTNYSNIPVERGILKYGKTKDEYDAEVEKSMPIDTGLMPDATTNETPEEIDARKKAEADQAKNDAEILADKNKPFTGSDVLNKWDDQGEFSDPQFKYTPGKAKFPFESLIGLTTGMVGAATADDVEIKYRDERIAEGMLQYAEDIAKIKNMGLSPEIEGGLKMKLASAYQTGLENIVRASNGNRNLVLGNQGQLDEARMKGIVEIVAMDVDRSDKAMAAFGEVQKYISEFESRKDIANNERRYQEDQKTQLAGAQLAQQGMSSFIDSIQQAKENAPGTMNDMKRQLFQFNVSGILPNAKPGEVGSIEHKEKVALEREIFAGKKRTFSDWKNTLNLDEQKLLHDIVVQNPNLNPDNNKNASFEELEATFKDLNGNADNQKKFYESKGVSQITTEQIEVQKTKVKEAAAGTQEEVVPKEPQYISPVTGPGRGHKPQTREEIYGTPIINTDGTITINNTKTKAPESKIVTTAPLADKTLQQQLDYGVNGLPTGPETIDPEKDANALQREESLIELQKN